MNQIKNGLIVCPLENCTWDTRCYCFCSCFFANCTLQCPVHTDASYSKLKPPKTNCNYNEEVWNMFLQKWKTFKGSTEISKLEMLLILPVLWWRFLQCYFKGKCRHSKFKLARTFKHDQVASLQSFLFQLLSNIQTFSVQDRIWLRIPDHLLPV